MNLQTLSELTEPAAMQVGGVATVELEILAIWREALLADPRCGSAQASIPVAERIRGRGESGQRHCGNQEGMLTAWVQKYGPPVGLIT